MLALLGAPNTQRQGESREVDASRRNRLGQTPKDVAAAQGFGDVVEALDAAAASAKARERGSGVRSPLSPTRTGPFTLNAVRLLAGLSGFGVARDSLGPRATPLCVWRRCLTLVLGARRPLAPPAGGRAAEGDA